MVDSAQGHGTLVSLTSDIVAAHVSRNPVPAHQLPALIEGIHQALAGLKVAPVAVAEPLKPAVPVRASVKPDHVTCLECGRKMSVLKRHLHVAHGLSPAEYRERWGLSYDHPLVAPDYATRRGVIARETGLGSAAMNASEKPEVGTKRQPDGQKRKTLTLWRNGEEKTSSQTHDQQAAGQTAPDPEPSSEKTLFEAIARVRMISAHYNGGEIHLAPHLLFSRHGELFLGAFNPRKNWRSDEKRRLGYFKVSGLSNVVLMEDTFVPLPTFDGSLPRETDEHLFAVMT